MRDPVSICLATYNGYYYIEDQVFSILLELQRDDELIIVDDCSDNETKSLLLRYQDPRIKIFFNKKNIGHVKTFEKCINYANHSIIILSDQDDIWVPGRVNKLVKNLLNSDKLLVTSNFSLIDNLGNPTNRPRNLVSIHNSSFYVSNIVGIFFGRRDYYGCTMAFNRDLLKFVTPIPSGTESHDLWFALMANVLGKNDHIDDITVLRRLHASNVTSIKRRSFMKITVTRIVFLKLIFIALKRKFF
jgi:glycosyltransferase involved in cell wall biosynthesis